MGIVLRQSFKNVVATYLGFAIGALNTLFLFTYFLSKAQYGLVSYVTSTATILSPLIAFGVNNTLVRYYTAYQHKEEQAKFNLMLCFLPLLIIVPATFIGVIGYEQIAQWLSAKNTEVRNYVLLIFLTSVAMAYFEIAYAWTRVQLKTVFGNFLKEVFHRVGVMLLLLAIYLQLIDFHQLIWGVFWVYALRMLLMFVFAFYVRRPEFAWGLPKNKKEVFLYSLFVILSGSVASVLMDIDKFMLNQYLPIGEIAVYNVAIFTATVIAIPYRSMYQIVSPLTAQFMNQQKPQELADLYKRSTVNTYFVSMVICVLIVVNAQQCYALLSDKDYSTGLGVLIIISVVKLSDALVGFSNTVLINSPYYRTVLFLGVFLVIGTVLMNMWLIPLYGINGAGLATLIAFSSYNLLKSVFVYRKYNLNPFYKETLQTTFFGIVAIGGFFFWDFPFHPLINIGLKSLLVRIIKNTQINMHPHIKNILENYTYPTIKSIAYPNGDMLVLEGQWLGEEYHLHILCQSTLDSYFKYNEADYVSNLYPQMVAENAQYEVYGGECSWEGDGFIYIINKEKGKLLWFLFLDNSEYFKEAYFEDTNHIITRSELNLQLRIPINAPEKLSVIK